MAPAKSLDPRDLANGAFLQCAEAATLGMPFEVWKTRMGRFRNEGTMEAFVNVYKRGGVAGFWQGTSAKMVESASKGAVLLFAKEGLLNVCQGAGLSPFVSGLLAGAGAGVAQTTVMGPCTFVVTAMVTSQGKEVNVAKLLSTTLKEKGIVGLYPGGTAIAFRQASNWASRQGFTEFFRTKIAQLKYGDPKAKLTKWDEASSGILGGAFSTWNQPFEVARIQMQAAAAAGEKELPGMAKVMVNIVKDQGPLGLFKGIVPRIGLGVWQTLFMVTGAKVLKEWMA
jgi:hypothetical protein